MSVEDNEFVPFLRDGRFYLTEKAVTVLVDRGLNLEAGNAARCGMLLDDCARLAEMVDCVQTLLSRLVSTHSSQRNSLETPIIPRNSAARH
jgi:hypothetical protein